LREKEKRKIAVYSVCVNFFLSVLKITTGIFSGSKALVADGIHSVSDLAASISVLAGIYISHLKVKEFPYGIYKVENIVSIISAFAIFFAGYEILRDVLFTGKQIQIINIWVAIFGIFLTIIVTFFFSRYEFKKGKELSSPSLIADSKHVKADMFSAAVVFVGVIGSYVGFPVAEKIAVVVVSAFIFRSGFEILVESIKVLLDVSIDAKTLEEIRLIMEQHPMVRVKSLMGRNSGSYKFVEAEIGIATNNFEVAHRIAHEIESEVLARVPLVERLIIHFEPEVLEEVKIAIPTDDGKSVSEEFGKSKKIFIFTINRKEGRIVNEEFFDNPFLNLKKGKGIELVEVLSKRGVNCLVLFSIPRSKGVIYALANNGIDLLITNERSIDNVLKKFLSREVTCEPAVSVWESYVCDLTGGKVESSRAF